jgi:hypothetical protein
MKKAIVLASLLALLVPGAAFAGSATDAALGLGAFAVFNQIISGTGIFGAFVPVPRPVVLPAPPLPVVVPAPIIAPPPVIVHEHRRVYVRPPVYYAPPARRVYHAPARTVVIEKRVVVPPGHARDHHARHRRNW